MQRLGIALFSDVEQAIVNAAKEQLYLYQPEDGEQYVLFDITINKCKLVAVYSIENRTFVTCYSPRKKVGNRKIKKIFGIGKKEEWYKRTVNDEKHRKKRTGNNVRIK